MKKIRNNALEPHITKTDILNEDWTYSSISYVVSYDERGFKLKKTFRNATSARAFKEQVELFIKNAFGIEDSEPEKSNYPQNLLDQLGLSSDVDILEAVSELPERERYIIEQKFIYGRSLRQIGKDLSLTTERTRQLQERAFRALSRKTPVGEITHADYLRALDIVQRYSGISPDKENIDNLDLSTRARNALRRAGIQTLEELKALSEDDLVNIRSLGKGTVEEILRKVK